MARFSEAWMQTLLAKSDIASIVSEYVKLNAKGRQLWGLCPFHNEKTPSFSVSADKQLYYCFGCGAGGSVVQFVMEVERLPYSEAIQFLAQKAGMELPEEINDEELRKERAIKERMYLAYKTAAKFYFNNLLSDEGLEARKYLLNRGLSANIIKEFGLGYARSEWEDLKSFLISEGFRESELVDAGLLIRHSSGRVYDAYRNRVIFPIIGANSKVIGFGARTMGDDLPKYINTGDTPIYSKRRTLYAINILKKQKASDAVIVEGYMDVISLHAAGVKNCVASLGTSLTQLQARLIKRYVSTVYIAYDGDTAGQNATLRGLEIFSSEGINVKVIIMPSGFDPDDYIKKFGKEGFLTLKDNALSLNEYKLERMAANYDLESADGREGYAKAGCGMIAELEPVEQERYCTMLARKTGITTETLKMQVARLKGSASKAQQSALKPSPKNRVRDGDMDEREKLELMLLGAVIENREIIKLIEREDVEKLFSNKSCYDIAVNILDLYKSGKDIIDVSLIMSDMSEAQARILALAISGETIKGDTLRYVNDCLKRIKEIDIDEEIIALKIKVDTSELPLNEKLDATKRIVELDLIKRSL